MIPQVTHFSRILKKVLKIFSKQADKVLAKSNSSNIWKEVLTTLYQIRNNRKLVKKDYFVKYVD